MLVYLCKLIKAINIILTYYGRKEKQNNWGQNQSVA